MTLAVVAKRFHSFLLPAIHCGVLSQVFPRRSDYKFAVLNTTQTQNLIRQFFQFRITALRDDDFQASCGDPNERG